jgi:ABC-type Fe3+-citrate transport system substrate-binding protein
MDIDARIGVLVDSVGIAHDCKATSVETPSVKTKILDFSSTSRSKIAMSTSKIV